MDKDRFYQMSLACNDAELAIGNVMHKVRLFENATNESLMVLVPLKDLRQLARCYPALNAIVNDPKFNCRGKK